MKKNNPANEMMLGVTMSIPLSAKLTLPLSKLALLLKEYPLLEQVKSGSELVYSTKSGGTTHAFHFGKTYIIQRVYCESSPVYSMRESLLRLIAIASFLQGAYEVRPESLFPYLIAELSKPELASFTRNPPPSRTGNPEVILAKRIMGLISEVERISQENSHLRSARIRLLSYLLLGESEKGIVIAKEFCEKYSLEVSEISTIEKNLSGFGFRLLMGGGKINLVKI
ncbi:MAG: hypothetical protein KGH71_02300 [Candidatus Micrarchaeota archaeon]|nr:hypothetical protein [Candidatus Micrarchaeota archaeon]